MKKQLSIFIALITVSVASAQLKDSLENERFSIHVQTTVINQSKSSFSVKYTGDNSLTKDKENQTSLTSTLYFGARLWKGAAVFINPEIAGGSGLSQALGVAAAPNGETFRVGDPSPKIYLARLYLQQIVPLSSEKRYQSSDFNQLGGSLPSKYVSFTIGKIGIADFFDDNTYSHDPRSQFISWALMSNGAWDYPANTRGYTPSAVVEYVSPVHELRYGMSLVPLTANGNAMNWDFGKASSHTLEYTRRHNIKNRKGAVRVLAFLTTANMGDYRQSIALNPLSPDIEASRKYGNTKYGWGINAEQELTDDLGIFARASWNDGKRETWNFTEIDQSVSVGASMSGDRWKRAGDCVGLAWVNSGISAAHKAYLNAGGKGFMLGDGKLNYGRETLGELYYSAELQKDHIYLSGFYQLLFNPGYNKDRKGPVNIFSLRLHARF